MLDTHSSSHFVWNEGATGAKYIVIMYLRVDEAEEMLEV